MAEVLAKIVQTAVQLAGLYNRTGYENKYGIRQCRSEGNPVAFFSNLAATASLLPQHKPGSRSPGR